MTIIAKEIRDGLFSISWTVYFPYADRLYSRLRENYKVKVDLLTTPESACKLTCTFEEEDEINTQNRFNIILEMRMAAKGHPHDSFKNAVVTASFDSVEQQMTLNESILRSSWPWNSRDHPNYSRDRDEDRDVVNFEILIDLKPDSVFSMKKGAKNVLDHLANLWENKTFYDVKFKCGQEWIQAHTLILAFGSPVLAAMFQNNFKEKQERVVIIKDIGAKIIRNLFRYIYVGECALLENGNQNAGELSELLVAADKYAVQSLKEECESHLSRILSVENVSKCLVLSHLHNCPELNRSVLNFMSENAKAVCTRKDWLKVIETYPKLCFQATQFMVGL